MFRKFLLSTVLGLGLLAAVVAPTEAAYHRGGHGHPARPHPVRRVNVVRHREFGNMAAANLWVRNHRVCDLRYEWHGPHVWVFYRV